MAGHGPQPKNPAARQRKNRLLSVAGGVDAPAPNPRWLKVTKDGWSAFWASGLAETVTEKDMSALVRLFDKRNLHEKLYRIVDKNLFIDGSRGQAVINPAMAALNVTATEIRQSEREFGLTPDAGARMVATAATATRSVEELVRSGDDDLQIIDVAENPAT